MSRKGSRTFLPKEAKLHRGHKVFPCDVVGTTNNRAYRISGIVNMKAFTRDRGVYLGQVENFLFSYYYAAICSLGPVALLS